MMDLLVVRNGEWAGDVIGPCDGFRGAVTEACRLLGRDLLKVQMEGAVAVAYYRSNPPVRRASFQIRKNR